MTIVNLPPSFTTVTPFSKLLAAILFITLPFVGFYLGLHYQEKNLVQAPSQISSSQALALVKDLPEVKSWLALFTGPGSTGPVSGGRPVIELTGTSGGIYSIHVYETVPPDGHSATFNRYQVDFATGKITPQPL